jgi:hypothetical protein
MPAACTGDTTIAINGTDKAPKLPPNPPFDIPNASTAGTARA